MLSSLLLLAAAPCAFAVTAYNPPTALLAKAQSPDNDCVLPKNFHIKNFAARSNGTGPTLGCFEFTFTDTDTAISTRCHFNSTSTSSSASPYHPRYPCENGLANFIWEDDKQQLSMIEDVCPDTNGKAEYEASGSVDLKLSCAPGTNKCAANMTDYTGLYVSLQPTTGSAQ